MLHGPAVELEKDNAVSQKSKLGIILFFVYLLIYVGFVAIGALYPHLMGETIIGQNLSIVYGFGLILLAVLMGLIYNFFCSRFENQLNQRRGLK
jgi:uncharacterized membrane protein (DUF485 family)